MEVFLSAHPAEFVLAFSFADFGEVGFEVRVEGFVFLPVGLVVRHYNLNG